MSIVDSSQEPHLSVANYIGSYGSYRSPLTYGYFLNKAKTLASTDGMNLLLSGILLQFIDMVYPLRPVNTFPPNHPNLVPLRISIIGDVMVGKKTIAKRLSALLNIPIIDVDKLIEKAKSFVRHDTPG